MLILVLTLQLISIWHL